MWCCKVSAGCYEGALEKRKKVAGLQRCWGDITLVADAWEKSQSNLAVD